MYFADINEKRIKNKVAATEIRFKCFGTKFCEIESRNFSFYFFNNSSTVVLFIKDNQNTFDFARKAFGKFQSLFLYSKVKIHVIRRLASSYLLCVCNLRVHLTSAVNMPTVCVYIIPSLNRIRSAGYSPEVRSRTFPLDRVRLRSSW